jgi:hypothetical protein
VGAGVVKRGLGAALVLWAGAATLGCVGTVVEQSFPALAERRAPIRRIAVAPLLARPEAAGSAAPVVARYLVDAFAARGFEVIPPEEVGRVSGALGPASGLPELAATLQREFGADAVLVGKLTRWVEREGGAAGSQRPASVGLQVDLYDVSEAQRLWRGEFDHTQRPLFENVLLTPRYPGGGMRWLTAEEFAQFGASELAAALPLVP